MNKKIKPYILIAPTAILVLGIMGFGIINCLYQSLGYFPYIGFNEISFDYYKEILRDTSFLKSLIFSLKTSFISTFIAVVVGVLLAYLLTKDKYSKLRISILNLPVVMPHIVVVFFIVTIFSQSGIISRILYNLGIISDSSQFINLISDKNGIGIIMVYLYKGIPYIVLTTYNILKNINDKLEIVATNLGASRFQTFRYITLPLAMPSIISCFIILFAFSFGSYEVPFLIGPSTPKTLSVLAYNNYISSDFNQKALSMVINMILSGISFILLIIYNKIFNKVYKYKL